MPMSSEFGREASRKLAALMSSSVADPTPATPPYSPDDFYRAYAIAMLNWQKVEGALFRLYFGLFEGGNLVQTGAAYYSLDSFGAKLRLVDATVGAVLKGSNLERWMTLHRAITSASRDRNALAHLPAVINVNADNSLSLVLAPHIFTPASLRRSRSKKYDAGEFQTLAFTFEELANRIISFATS